MPSRELQVAGRTALVTGAAGGIGLAVSQALHARGATVGLVDVAPEALDATAAGMGGGAAVHAFAADVRDRERMAAVVDELQERTGRLDVVVANAGVVPEPATLLYGDRADFDRVLDINLHGVLNTVSPALRSLIAAGGHAVVVASVAAFTPTPGGSAYTVSKAAVEALGRSLRLELAAHGVSVQVAYFGVVETAMTRRTLDEDPIGQTLERLLPAPLRRRVSAADAAETLVCGIERRASRTLAPRTWAPYAWMRGVGDHVVDAAFTRDPRLRRVIAALEARSAGG